MWSKTECVHYTSYDADKSKEGEMWYRVESRHNNGLMKISFVQPGTENVEETLEKVKNNVAKELTEEMFKLNAEKLAQSASEDIYESLPADFLDKFDPEEKEKSKLGVDKPKN